MLWMMQNQLGSSVSIGLILWATGLYNFLPGEDGEWCSGFEAEDGCGWAGQFTLPGIGIGYWV